MKKVTERYLSERDRSRVNAPLKTIGFIVDEMLFTDFDFLYDMYKELNIVPKDVKVFTFIEVRKRIPSLRQNQVQCKDFNWKGEMHNQNATEFLDRDFDVLVGYYEGKHEFLDAMVSQSRAKFKVGFSEADDRLYDLIISVKPTDKELFKKELVKYLTILNKIQPILKTVGSNE